MEYSSVFVVHEGVEMSYGMDTVVAGVFSSLKSAEQYCAERYKTSEWPYGQVPFYDLTEYEVQE